jgi:hypothetical protein
VPADAGARGELDQPPPAEQVRDGDGTDEPVRQPLGHDADQRFHRQLAAFQAVGQLVRANTDDREVKRTPTDAFDHLGRRLVDDVQLDPGVTLGELRDRPGHVDAARAGLDHPDGQPPLLKTQVGTHLGPRPRLVGDDPPGVRQQQLAGRGELRPPLAAHEQRRAELVLKAADLLTERGLGHEARLGRLREVAQLRDRDEVPQMTNLHPARLCVDRSAKQIEPVRSKSWYRTDPGNSLSAPIPYYRWRAGQSDSSPQRV